MKKSTNYTYLIVMAACYFFIQGCISPNAGTGTDTSTRAFARGLVTSSGAPLKGTIVGLYPANYNPLTDTIPDFSKDTTDSSGAFSLSSPNSGTFNLLAHSANDSIAGIVRIALKHNDTGRSIHVNARKPGVLTVNLAVTNATQGGSVYISGTPFIKKISSRNIVFDHIPEGAYPSVNYIATSKSKSVPLTQKGVKVFSNESSILFSVTLIVGSKDTPSHEITLLQHLDSIGGECLLMDDDELSAKGCSTASVILISASSEASKIGSFFKNFPVPLLVTESYLFDDIGFTDTTINQSFGIKDTQSTISIALPDHPIANKVNGVNIPIRKSPGSVGWGKPKGDVSVIATLKNDSAYATVFCYESQARMRSIPAPHRRVGFFMRWPLDLLTPDGVKLFDNSMYWLLERL